MKRAAVAIAAALLALAGCRHAEQPVRIGVQENLGASPALLGLARDAFQTNMKVPARPIYFASSGAALDAVLGEKVDIAYVDIVCAVNAFVRSRGRYVIIAGTSAGGGALVVSSTTEKVDGLRDDNVGTPQPGDLEDVVARQFFAEQGFVSREQGGDFQINPAANLDLLPLFIRGNVGAVWATEPWVSALEREGRGHVLIRDEDLWKQANRGPDVSVVVVASRALMKRHPEVIDGFLSTHVSLVNALRAGGGDDRRMCAQEFGRLVGRTFSDAEMASAWSRVRFATDIPRDAVVAHAYSAFRVGFLGPDVPDLKEAVDDGPLSRALAPARSR